MPNIKSAKKRLRQNEVCRLSNAAKKGAIRQSSKAFDTAIAGEDQDAKKAAYAKYCSALDKAVKTNVIKKNNAIRNKSRAAAKLTA